MNSKAAIMEIMETAQDWACRLSAEEIESIGTGAGRDQFWCDLIGEEFPRHLFGSAKWERWCEAFQIDPEDAPLKESWLVDLLADLILLESIMLASRRGVIQ